MGLSSICRGDGHTVDTFEEQSGNRGSEREMEDACNPYLSAGFKMIGSSESQLQNQCE